MRQGAGKVKLLCGKLLWIQDCLMVDDIQLLKIITLWNLADAAAKPLSGKRIKLLLHEITTWRPSKVSRLLLQVNMKFNARSMVAANGECPCKEHCACNSTCEP